ncbi:hypothetical protein B0A48_03332 [Cryoendolithus antarcticus]|uniref:amidase n=1 Tax=Cryoendolithus antarcticus TaxID=1507870 RepID=A0A1V8TJQ1_9PEZI|nr:hypothetical protein B0A48_03332 [Cryoendolithus antarcticus]
MSWEETVASKRAVRDAAVAEFASNGLTSPKITDDDDASSLVRRLKDGEVSTETVVRAYINNACKAQAKTNCLTEVCFAAAIERAQALDAHLKTTGDVMGPLHGVPVSLKDQFDLKGIDSTIGYVGRVSKPATANAWIVDVLERLGAVIIAKTNLPQSIMVNLAHADPLNPLFTVGGSSGGEAAMLALHGSLIGFGTDIGGSIRMPAHMNGLWGLKPTSNRMSYRGVTVSTDGQQHVPSSVGPMTRSLSSMVTITKAIVDAEPWSADAQCPRFPWRNDCLEEYSTRPLTIGLMLDDGVVKVHPPIERLFRELAAKLQEAGHDVVQWDVGLNAQCVEIMDAYYTADGGEDIKQAVGEGGEPFIPHVKALVERGPAISVYEYWKLNRRKVAAQQAYHEMWDNARSSKGQPIDIILTPTMAHTSLPHRKCRWVGYTKLFNLVDYTALSFPVGRVSKTLDSAGTDDYVPRNAYDAWNWAQYDSESMDGHHVGLQLVGRRYDEEKVLGAALQVEKLLNG